MDEVEIGQFGPIALTNSPFDALAHNIDADTQMLGVGLRVGRQKMTMSAAYFPHKRLIMRENRSETVAQITPAILHQSKKLGSASWVIHGE